MSNDPVVWPEEGSLLWWLAVVGTNCLSAVGTPLKPGRHEFALTVPEDGSEATFEFTISCIEVEIRNSE